MAKKHNPASALVSSGPLKPIQEVVTVTTSGPLTKEEMIESILHNPNMTKTQRRVAIEVLMGLRKPKGTKKKYATKEERKAAAKIRAKERRAAKLAELPEAVRPSPRIKLEPEEKKAKRRERGQAKRANYRLLLANAAASPEMLEKLDPKDRFNLLQQVSRMKKKPEGLNVGLGTPPGVDTSNLPGMPKSRRNRK